MEHPITIAAYIQFTGIVSGAGLLLIVYWIKEIKGLEKSLDQHRQDDEKEFNDSQRENDAIHAQLRQEIGRVKGGAENSITELRGDIKLMNGKLDTLIELTKQTMK